MTPEGLRVALK